MTRPPLPRDKELPPAGGYEPIKFKRNLPIRGPSGTLIISGVFATCLYGFYRYGQGNVEKRELKRENMWSRIHLVPILTAENDRDLFRRQRAQLDREREIMKDDPNWVVGQSVYNTKLSPAFPTHFPASPYPSTSFSCCCRLGFV
ncbi:hypothetical protein PCANC_10398 [Puccinia coronata f. sp. avenae]|uniref:NADH dehydrogenase [ubiquinone] 1 alpha subcomplex subunit 13 n=1 Tax=Puccinia coronata f. sp. avenae TaxID=200324 RepID=A0A2N5STR1_9BASI|nr:hypothetical protein PCANC_10398 [Puccinia coronata f. sp. avenae]PLW31662.1 hypothetical protein PCASD_10895 [Puccinia coronata f. sp. avenae]